MEFRVLQFEPLDEVLLGNRLSLTPNGFHNNTIYSGAKSCNTQPMVSAFTHETC
jgi:hypothetical protein